MAVALIALFVAGGGTAAAAHHYLITKSSQVKPGVLQAKNLSGSARRTLRGARGPHGTQGPPGPAGVAALTRVDGPAVPQGAFGSGTEVQTSTATCPAGTFVTGGGYELGTIDDIV